LAGGSDCSSQRYCEDGIDTGASSSLTLRRPAAPLISRNLSMRCAALATRNRVAAAFARRSRSFATHRFWTEPVVADVRRNRTAFRFLYELGDVIGFVGSSVTRPFAPTPMAVDQRQGILALGRARCLAHPTTHRQSVRSPSGVPHVAELGRLNRRPS